MLIHFHGAAQTVTGSQHLLEINGKKILLDCGLFQGHRKDTYYLNRHFHFEPSEIDAVLVSHAHIDHSGNLPSLVKNGYTERIYSTPATTDLLKTMLRDSGKIHEYDVLYVNKRRQKRGESPLEPLYTIADAEAVDPYFSPIEYNKPFSPAPGVTARFVEAGHILGSASIVLDIKEQGRTFRVWFSGDVGRFEKPLLRDPVLPEGADYLIMESTYGDKSHKSPQSSYDELLDVVSRTIKRNGKVIIPAFSVGRTQELVYLLHQAMDKGAIPEIPVFVDSPLAVNVTDIFRKHTDIFDEETHEFMAADLNHTALGFERLTYIRSVEESKALNKRKDPMVIISASGMAETGRILHHLKNNIEDPRNTILITSWMAPHTLGRRLAEGEKKVKIFGEKFKRNAEVATINGFSAHAGQDALINYALASKDTLKKVFLVHGEERGALPLMEELNRAGLENVYYPAPHSVWTE